MSGTSGGAVCAVLVWHALERGEDRPWRQLMDFWQDNSAKGWAEIAFNKLVVDSVRMINSGLLPTFQLSPASAVARSLMQFATMGLRENFTSFKALLEAHVDFAEIASWGPRAKRPILMVGAANVTSGMLTKFISNREPIRVEHVLASCAVPTIFPAVQIGEDVFWDGLFSDNPPVQELIRPSSVGAENVPEEIWLIKINPTRRETVPVRIDDIIDRRNQLEGNISLFQQLRHVEMLNDMLLSRCVPARVPRPVRHQGAGAYSEIVLRRRPTSPITSPASRCRRAAGDARLREQDRSLGRAYRAPCRRGRALRTGVPARTGEDGRRRAARGGQLLNALAPSTLLAAVAPSTGQKTVCAAAIPSMPLGQRFRVSTDTAPGDSR